jgi:YcxB-like protein
MHTVEYASSRREVWRWYWRAWAKPDGLWLFHVGIAIVIAASLSRGIFEARRFAVAAIFAFILCAALLPLWPQIRFKSARRSLTIDPSGIRTTIGKVSGSRAWAQISSVEDRGEEIIIAGRNRNAFIIPMRAFTTETNRQDFLRDAKRWHAERAA